MRLTSKSAPVGLLYLCNDHPNICLNTTLEHLPWKISSCTWIPNPLKSSKSFLISPFGFDRCPSKFLFALGRAVILINSSNMWKLHMTLWKHHMLYCEIWKFNLINYKDGVNQSTSIPFKSLKQYDRRPWRSSSSNLKK